MGFRKGRADEEGNNGRVGGSSHSTDTPLHSTSTSTRRRSLCQHHRSRCPPGLHRRLHSEKLTATVRRELQSRTAGPTLWVTSGSESRIAAQQGTLESHWLRSQPRFSG